jgi:metal-responsive CopG/Arc/MetJ family transcriptional regulator
MNNAARKVTFSLHEDVLEGLADAVREGAASSKNALVERALRNELRELRRQAQRRRWEVAMKDRRFIRDLEETEAAFASADAETARRIG